ncbi:hypothetical protein Cme02nite_64990 [Catellatospora methionotrophica]|uniref:STAS domain-containing protein n=2 Tax=Catellatospora methionotrophica TaxID=121620 RepID=A0A8J3PI80_9ACTN|nr:hypothetical protein Cme02nite_64990 [Catellatospora methionotrophica]
MSIAGDVDLVDPVDVDVAQRQLVGMSCDVLYVDLARVTFGGSGLIHYLYNVSEQLPDVPITLCGSTEITRQVLELAGLDGLAAMCDSLPQDWASAKTSPASDLRLAGDRVTPVRPQPAT